MNEQDLYRIIAESGGRLDKCLATAIADLSRSRLQALIEGGQVRVAGKVVKDAAHKLKAGDVCEVHVPQAAPTHLISKAAPLDIVYEDDDLLVINKAPGMTVHPAPGHADDTLVNALLAHCGDTLSGIGGVARPGIVHRLDKDTSGLLVVAKHDKAHAALAAQLADRTLKRVYLAVVWGVPNPRKGKVEGAIGRSPKNRKKMAVVKSNGKEALTYYDTQKTFYADGKALASVVECTLDTGRTHQIRVHMTHIGHALLGDDVYGRAPHKVAGLGIDRQALHAFRIGFLHPKTRKKMEFEAPIPSDMEALILALGTCKA